MTKPDVLEILEVLNPDSPSAKIRIYADAFMTYQEAQANIDEHGAMVAHQKTGAPIENPYLKIRDSTAKQLLGMDMAADGLW